MARNFSPNQRKQIWSKDVQWGGFCWCGICGKRVESHTWDADHIIPYEQGGPTTVQNGQVTHPKCNRSKQNRYQKRDGGPSWSRRWGQEFSYNPY